MTAFVAAAVLAGIITLLFYRHMSANTRPRSATQIVVAASDLPVGQTLSQRDVQLLDWYSDALPSGAFTKTDAVLGHPLLYPISAKEPILERDLGVEGAGIGLAGKIPQGMRATAVRSNEIVGVAGFLYPGSHVDVLATFTPPGGGSLPVTETVLQNVEVLTSGQTMEPDPQGRPQSVNVVTLLLTPQDSQRIQLASSQGTIQFVLRSGADQKSGDLVPTALDELLLGQKKPVVRAPSPEKHAPRKAPAPGPAPYFIEVIQGTQRSNQKF